MLDDYTVKVDMYDKQNDEHFVRVFQFPGYCKSMSFELKQVLYDIENAFFQFEGAERENWSDDSKQQFGKIRKKLLDSINGIARLPDTLCYKNTPCNSIPASELITKMLDNK